MAIKTRQTTATGVTNNNAPLTNDELDNNFVELQQNKYESGDNIDVGTVTADGLTVDSSSSVISTFNGTAATGVNVSIKNTEHEFYIGTNDGNLYLYDVDNTATRFHIASNGDISFYEDTGATAKFFWDASAESLGIGTTSPNRPLQVSMSSLGATVASFKNDGGPNAQIGFQASGSANDANCRIGVASDTDFVVFTGNSESVRVDDSGNVGIGTSSNFTDAQLHISGINAGGDNSLRIQNASTTSGTTTSLKFTNTTVDYAHASLTSDRDKNLIFKNTDDTVETMRITSGGDVLIGTTDTSPNNNSAGNANDNGTAIGFGLIQSAAYKSTANSGSVAYLNRTGTDGNIAQFYKDGATVGSIGVDSSTRLYFTNSSGAGLFLSSGTQVEPMNNGSRADATMNIGGATYRFKDLYLSGKSFADTYQFAQNSSAVGATEAIYRPGTGSIAFKANSAERMRIDSSGNLLVGKTVTTLGTEGTLIASGQIQQTKSAGAPLLANRTGSSGTEDGTIIDIRSNSATVGSIGTTASGLTIGSGDTGLFFDSAEDSVKPRNSSGAARDAAIDLGKGSHRFKDLYLSGIAYAGSKVLAGGTSASSSGQVAVISSSSPYVSFHEGSTRKAYMQWVNSGYLQIRNEEGTDVRIRGNGDTELELADNAGSVHGRLKIYAASTDFAMQHENGEQIVYGRKNQNTWLYYNGLWKIRTEDDGASINDESSTVRLHMRTGNGTDRGSIYATNSNEIGILDEGGNWAIKHTNDSKTEFFIADTLKFTIGASSVVSVNDLTVNSDERIKDNIEQIPDALEKVQAIRGVTFNRTDTDDDTRHAGVIAQEVEKVLPEVVTENEETGIKSVAYANMVGLLIEAIKEQQTQIDDLKNEVTRLKGFE